MIFLVFLLELLIIAGVSLLDTFIIMILASLFSIELSGKVVFFVMLLVNYFIRARSK